MRVLSLAIRAVLALTLLMSLLWLALLFSPAPKAEWEKTTLQVQPLPKGSFVQEESAYQAINGAPFELNFNPPSEQLPDLRSFLIYYGKDWRPDAKPDQQQMHFSLRGAGKDRETMSVRPGEKVYLGYEEKKNVGYYTFSPSPTSFWFEPGLEGEEAVVLVYLQRRDSKLVQQPQDHHRLVLEEKEQPRFGGGSWQLGETRVDGSLLARQRARWYGPDLFLEEHGGEEFAEAAEKERIQFGNDDDRYQVHVGEGDFLVWKENRWQEANLGEETQGYPLLQLNTIEARMLRFELWDVGGKRKMMVNLVRSTEMWKFPGFLKIRFVGARTRTHSILEFDGERIVVGPDEWLLRQDDKWIKLNTVELIDDYVEGRLIGDLFVCEGVQRREAQQFFAAHVFNPSRSAMESIELSAQSDEVRIVDPNGEEESSPEPRSPLRRLPEALEEKVDDVLERLPIKQMRQARKDRSSIIERSNRIREERQREKRYLR